MDVTFFHILCLRQVCAAHVTDCGLRHIMNYKDRRKLYKGCIGIIVLDPCFYRQYRIPERRASMQDAKIILTSITYANKAQHILAGYNIRSRITKLDSSTAHRGCGYALCVDSRNISEIQRILRENYVKVVDVIV